MQRDPRLIPTSGSQRFAFQSSGLAVRASIIFVFFAFRGVPLSENEMPIFGYDFSKSLATVILAVGLSVMALPRLMKPMGKPFYLSYGCALLFFFTIAWAIAVYSGDARSAIPVYLEVLSAFALIHLTYLNFASAREIQWLYGAINLAAVANSVWMLITYVQDPASVFRLGAIGATGASYNTAAYMIAAGLWVGPLSGLTRRGPHGWTLISLMMSPILVGGILLTGTKGGTVCIGALIILAMIVGVRTSALGFAGGRFVAVALAIIMAAAIGIWSGGIVPVERAVEVGPGDDLLTSRAQMWRYAIDQVTESSLRATFGAGLGTYSYEIWTPSSNERGLALALYSHNLLLDVAFNAGLPACVIMALWLWRSWAHSWRGVTDPNRKVAKLHTQATGLAVVAIFSGMISFKFTANALLFVFIGSVARLAQMRKAGGVPVDSRHGIQHRPSLSRPLNSWKQIS